MNHSLNELEIKELLGDLEMAIVLAKYYLEDHEGNPNVQYAIDCEYVIDAQAALTKLKEILK